MNKIIVLIAGLALGLSLGNSIKLDRLGERFDKMEQTLAQLKSQIISLEEVTGISALAMKENP